MKLTDFQDTLNVGGQSFYYLSLKKLASHANIDLSRLPVCHKILLENVVRNECIRGKDSSGALAAFKRWQSGGRHHVDYAVNFTPFRILMQDFTGVAAVVDLASMREAVKDMGLDAKRVNPVCQIDLVVDHSVQVDAVGKQALQKNIQLEMQRNKERYQLLNWAQHSFSNMRVVPPGKGICHQVNLEYLATVVAQKTIEHHTWVFPDTLVGLDSHTTMVNALSVLGWGVGGIEAEAALLGRPLNILIPDVVGVQLTGCLQEGVTATDLVLTLTEALRRQGVVGKIVEFFGPGVKNLTLADRATIANMSPEFGSTSALFAIDEETLSYLRMTGRTNEQVDLVACYAREQTLWHEANPDPDLYSETLNFDLSQVETCLAGPKRPQDKVLMPSLGFETEKCILKQDSTAQLSQQFPVPGHDFHLRHGHIVLAAITSCTNTSNPHALIAAGLLAKKALALGLKVKPWVKTSFAPGSGVVVEYLKRLDLIKPLEDLGFYVVGFGCTTCIGNSGPLDKGVEQCIENEHVVVSGVLSGNRNFEGRIHPLVSMNWLASPALVVAYALVGSTRIDMRRDPLGLCEGKKVFLSGLWPSDAEVQAAIEHIERSMFINQYQDIFKGDGAWSSLNTEKTACYPWDEASTYIRKPVFFEASPKSQHGHDVTQARALLILGDAVTTDHISPAGAIKADSPAGIYLQAKGTKIESFNSYGSRRGNHEVMIRGTFANHRIRNAMVPNIEGGFTSHMPSGELLPVYDAACRYAEEQTPLVVIAGKDYGTGSSRDWAAKGTRGLGVLVVIAESFERIHRSNLIGMGVLPCQFVGESLKDLQLTGSECFSLHGIADMLGVHEQIKMTVTREDGAEKVVTLMARLDTIDELMLYREGGIFNSVIEAIKQEAVGP